MRHFNKDMNISNILRTMMTSALVADKIIYSKTAFLGGSLNLKIIFFIFSVIKPKTLAMFAKLAGISAQNVCSVHYIE